MPINNGKRRTLYHFGIPGMRWGHRKLEESSESSDHLRVEKAEATRNVEHNADILKQNPNAAVVNYDAFKDDALTAEDIELIRQSQEERDARNRKIRNIAIGVGVGLTVAAGVYLYAKNKDQVDGAVQKALGNIRNKKVSEAKEDLDPNMLPKDVAKVYEKLGLKEVDTPQEAVAANFVASWLGHDKHRYDAISDESFSSMSDEDLSLKAGQAIKRITHTADETIRDNAYVSFDEDDANRYAAFLPALRKANGRLSEKPETYQMLMEATTEIRSPSSKKRVQILEEVIRENPDIKKKFEAAHEADLYGNSDSGLGLGPGDLFPSPEKLAKKYYNAVATGLCNRDDPVSKKYLEKVRAKGYNALVDDNDAGRLARTPLILLDSKAVTAKGTRKLSHSDLLSAVNSIKPMSGESTERTKEVLDVKLDFWDKMLAGDPKQIVKVYFNALYE